LRILTSALPILTSGLGIRTFGKIFKRTDHISINSLNRETV
jgi:hypothetical protein